MIKIRRMTAHDRVGIYELMQQNGRLMPRALEEIIHRIDFYLFDADQRLYKVILAENETKEILGYAVYGSDPNAVGTYQIYYLLNSPVVENGEVLLQLLHFIENEVVKNKGRIIVSEISSGFQYKNQFEIYQKQNFKLSSRIENFYSEGEDKLIFSKNITANPVC